MNPSCLSTAKMLPRKRDARTSTVGCLARDALRILVNPPAMGSMWGLPARFHQAGDLPAPGHLTKAHPAQTEPPVDPPPPAAALAPVHRPHFEFRGAFPPFNPRFSRHRY